MPKPPPSRTNTAGRKPNPDSHAGKIRSLEVMDTYYADLSQAQLGSIAARQKEGHKEFATRRTGKGATVWRVK